ncbi:MAG: EMC3/TMCO1 family protein [Candidatus Altiarchaeota archaeon]|nr:EMC3/TMCO1 family protein [Candidatus Altiarchaeota archaeon]
MISVTYDGQIIALVSVALSAMSTLVRVAVLDKNKMAAHKEKIKTHQELLKEAQKKKDLKAMQKHQEELFAVMGEQMRHSFKPMIFTMIPFLLVFGWLKGNYEQSGTVAVVLGQEVGWFWWYFLVSMVFSLLLNKIFKLS